MDILTTAAQSYINTFNGYMNQFLHWGQWLFFSLLAINIVWMCLWHAFDRHSFSESMPDFIKKFFVISLFYTIMVNPAWLMSILKTAEAMGSTLTHLPLDPSSLISQGIAIGNKIITPMHDAGLLSAPIAIVVGSILFVGVVYAFIRVALDLALTMIMTSVLIAIAAFFLGFSALGATSQIARQTLDVILANCVKLLGIYLVIAAGSQTITMVVASIPTTLSSFDAYGWLAAVVGLFYMLARTLPEQLARIVSGSVMENKGVDPAALAMTAVHYARTSMPALKAAGGISGAIAKIAGSTAANAGAHFNKATVATGNIAAGVGAAVGGSMGNLSKAVGGHVSDHFKSIANKMAGGPGSQQPITSISERMYQSTQDMKSGRGNPSSAGLDAAAPSSTKSMPKSGNSQPK